MRYRLLLLILFTGASVAVNAQRYSYRSALPSVQVTGFYKVAITPDVAARSMRDLRDARIRDEAGKEVPYLTNTETLVRDGGIHPFAIDINEKGTDGHSHIVLRNDAPASIESIQLLLRNTSVRRMASVSGSRDGRQYFSLRDSMQLIAVPGRNDTGMITVLLPPTTYPFIQIIIYDRGMMPLEILGAGIYRDAEMVRQLEAVPQASFVQKDSSNRKSYIHIRFHKPYRVDKLELLFEKLPYYKRSGMLYTDGEPPAQFTASNTQPAIIWTALKDTAIDIVIDNEDNPPLQLQNVVAWQQRLYLIAHLAAGTNYALTFGDSTLGAPLYDLRYFRDSIKAALLEELRPGDIREVVRSASAKASEQYIGKRTLWVIIIIVLIGLVAATVSLMKRVSKQAE